MAVLVSDVIGEAVGLLNDTAQTLYTNPVMIPFVKRAYNELENRLRRGGLPYDKKIDNVASFASGTLIYPLPTDFFQPINLYEHDVGGSDNDFVLMEERAWEPNLTQDTSLRYWVWRNGNIEFLGATTNRVLRLQYLASFPAIAAVGDTIVLTDARMYLASRSAALAARYIAQDRNRYSDLMEEAGEQLDDIVSQMVQKNQSLPARPHNYRPRFRRVFQRWG